MPQPLWLYLFSTLGMPYLCRWNRAGNWAVDEQFITEESAPEAAGDRVVIVTLCLDSDLKIRATKVGSDTTLARILQVVQEAQTTKPAIQRLADRIAPVFVPFVLIYSLLIFVLWIAAAYDHWFPDYWRGDKPEFIFAFEFFLSSVVVACPCAMGLAVPSAIMVGTGVAASNGLLIKDGPTLERTSKITVTLFDKTGTLTTGLSVVATTCNLNFAESELQNLTETDVKLLIGAVESRSTHPVAVAIAKAYGVAPFAASTNPDTASQGLSEDVHGTSILDLNVVNKPGNGVEATLTVKTERGHESQLKLHRSHYFRQTRC
jgi:Cu+-exporting ATPase